MPERPSTPAPSGWVSGTNPLARNVVSTGAPSRSASARTASVASRAPCPTMITGRRAARSRSSAASSGGGAMRRSARRPSGPCGGRVRGQVLHLVGEHEVGDAAPVDRVLDRGGGELGVVGARVHGHRGDRDVAEDRRQVEVLERAPAQHLRRHLPGDREHRSAVELGVVEPGEQVGRAGPGDREARRGTAGELAVGGGGERGRALVADADVAQLAAVLGAPQRLGEPQVGVPDHAEDRVDPPGDERLHQHVGHRARALRHLRQLHVGAVGALLDRVRHGASEKPAGGVPGRRVCSRSRATGSAATRSRSSPHPAGRPGAGSGCPRPRRARRSG